MQTSDKKKEMLYQNLRTSSSINTDSENTYKPTVHFSLSKPTPTVPHVSALRSYQDDNPFWKSSINRILGKGPSSEYTQVKEIQFDVGKDLLRRFYTVSESAARKAETWKFYQFAIIKPKLYIDKFVKLYLKYFYLKRKYREEIMMELLGDITDSELHKLDVDYLENYAQNKKSILTEIKGKCRSILGNPEMMTQLNNERMSFGISLSKILGSTEAMILEDLAPARCGKLPIKKVRTVDVGAYSSNLPITTTSHHAKSNFKKSMKVDIKNPRPADKIVEELKRNLASTNKKGIAKNIQDKLSYFKAENSKIKTSNLTHSGLIKKSNLKKSENISPNKIKATNLSNTKISETKSKQPRTPINLTPIPTPNSNPAPPTKPSAIVSKRKIVLYDNLEKRPKKTDISKFKLSSIVPEKHESGSLRPRRIADSPTKATPRTALGLSVPSSVIRSLRVINTGPSLHDYGSRRGENRRNTLKEDSNGFNDLIKKKISGLAAGRTEGRPRVHCGSMRSMRLIK